MVQQEKLRKEEKHKLELERLRGVMKARDKSEKTLVQDESRKPLMRVNLAGSSTDIAYGYVKKDCVFRVTAEEGETVWCLFLVSLELLRGVFFSFSSFPFLFLHVGGQFLFQAIDKDDMLAWIKVINQATERASVIRHKSVLYEVNIEESDIPKPAPKRQDINGNLHSLNFIQRWRLN